jgi:hypothetical protein
MSGRHKKHLNMGYGCWECHGHVVDKQMGIVGPALHVNGKKDLKFNATNFTFANGKCTGSCHGEGHNTSW